MDPLDLPTPSYSIKETKGFGQNLDPDWQWLFRLPLLRLCGLQMFCVVLNLVGSYHYSVASGRKRTPVDDDAVSVHVILVMGAVSVFSTSGL